jgi:hypothetical protein
VETVCDVPGLYAVAASDGNRHAMVLANLTGSKLALTLEGVDLQSARYHVIDQERLLSWAPNAHTMDNNDVVLVEW